MIKKNEFEPAKMVGWYNPIKLGQTAVQVLITTIFGRNADRRLLEAASNKHGNLPPKKPLDTKEPDGAAAPPQEEKDCCPEPFFYDASDQMENGEFWFDYIADVGDGFNSTYSMAYHITQPTLTFGDEVTKQGRIIIFGGDEVYPIATEEYYKNNLTGPYTAALPRPEDGDAEKAPKAFAIPGNHDWYDSLAGFSFLFMENHFGKSRWFAGWEAKQERSYFAIKLPAGWWLFATDMQLSSSLDTPQMEYFHYLMNNKVGKNDKIILYNAEPSWITQQMYRGNPAYDNKKIGFFEGNILGKRTSIFVAGDRHYYKRHEEIKKDPADQGGKRQRIVSGGGGAFLHPTHKEAVETVGLQPKYEHKASFPDEKTSAGLNWWNWLFFFRNWRFGILTGIVYVLTSWAFLAPIGEFGPGQFWPALKVVMWTPVEEPTAFFWMAAIFGGFFLFTDTTSKAYRFGGGFVHGILHLAGVFFVSWAVSHHIDPTPGHSPADWHWWQIIIGAIVIFLGGLFVGPTIMGIYLFFSLNVFGRHHNEAFSALKIEDYKNFIRFKIEEDGEIVIYPVGVKKVFKNWPDPLPDRGRIEPTSREADNEPFLIEKPIRYKKTGPAAAAAEDDG